MSDSQRNSRYATRMQRHVARSSFPPNSMGHLLRAGATEYLERTESGIDGNATTHAPNPQESERLLDSNLPPSDQPNDNPRHLRRKNSDSSQLLLSGRFMRMRVSDLPVYRQNQWIRWTLLLLLISLCFTELVSYQLIQSHYVDGFVAQHQWVLYVVGGFSVFVVLLYLLPCFQQCAVGFQLFTLVCMVLTCTAVITLVGTYLSSSSIFLVVGIVTAFIFVMMLTVMSNKVPFSKMLGYSIVSIAGILAFMGWVWVENRQELGDAPSERWLQLPTSQIERCVTIALSMYCSYGFVYAVPVAMNNLGERDYVSATIRLYFDLVKMFAQVVMSYVFAQGNSSSSSSDNQQRNRGAIFGGGT